MSAIIEEYLENVKNNLRLEAPAEKEVIHELATHIEDKVQELKENGLHEEEAANTCIRLFGSAKSVARQIYEAHSQGTWQQALMASLPHILFGLIFLLNWWRGIGWVLVFLFAILTTTVYGWWRGRSSWLFPWLGYSLLPVVIAGLSLLFLPRALAWVAILLYIPLALWLILRVVGQTLKKDWLHLSLMLFPMPLIIAFFVLSEWRLGFDDNRFMVFGPWIGISFLSLAFGVLSFVRIRRRWMKIAVLFMTGAIALALISGYSWGRISFIDFLLLMLLLVSIFLIPALLENGVRTGKWGKSFEHRPMT
ncbi:MAG: hypothetical protein JXA46_13390 [Dehalococcoidales bacterium]|nr:hypothetical protein [Dehalococcoidales bacterium]